MGILRWLRQGIYRLRQFGQGLFAQIRQEEREIVASLLPFAATQLFLQLPADAQRHSLNVLHDLSKTGNLHPDLTVAALLHDIGKLEADRAGVAIQLWLRGPLVLLNAFSPTIYHKLASDQPNKGWRYALYVYQTHPQIGAVWAEKAGCSILACWLIEHHQTPIDKVDLIEPKEKEVQVDRKKLLKLLQWADERN